MYHHRDTLQTDLSKLWRANETYVTHPPKYTGDAPFWQ
jgi:hypothetical protein